MAITNYFAPADFIFAGRLRHPVAILNGPEDIDAFAEAGPEGRIVAPLFKGPTPDWPPLETLRYGPVGRYGIWSTKRP